MTQTASSWNYDPPRAFRADFAVDVAPDLGGRVFPRANGDVFALLFEGCTAEQHGGTALRSSGGRESTPDEYGMVGRIVGK
ncbi:MAG: hypothetical protein AAF735_08540 [Myxococcota bacterium]